MKTDNTRILVIEDNPEERRTLADLFKTDASIHATFAGDGEQGARLLHEREFDIAIIDLGLPRKSGRQVLVEARRDGIRIPILILTGSRDEFAESDNLDDGANDYVLKPFRHRALMSRLRALLRGAVATRETAIRFRGLSFDTFRRAVRGEGVEKFTLPPVPSSILETMLRHRSGVVDSETLITEVWGYDADIVEASLQRNIRRLNAIFESRGLGRVVRVITGRGYELVRD